jgi:hypothetical protein
MRFQTSLKLALLAAVSWSSSSSVSAAAIDSSSLSISTRGLGVNCRGSSTCNYFYQPNGDAWTDRPMQLLMYSLLGQLPTGAEYSNGQHIACLAGKGGIPNFWADGALCLFLQNAAAPVPAVTVELLLQDLLDHDCSACGSIPVTWGTDVSQGELTVNYVAGNQHCNGVC